MAGPSELAVARGLLHQARVRLGASAWDAAAALAERAREVYVELEARHDAFQAAHVSARARRGRGDLGGARACWEWIAEEAVDEEDLAWLSAAANEAGAIAEELGDVHTAVTWFRRSLRAAQQRQSDEAIAIACGNIGRMAQRLGALSEAAEHFGESRQRFERGGLVEGAIRAAICQGEVLRLQQAFGDATEAFAAAAAQAASGGHQALDALASLHLGHTARDTDDVQTARACFERARTLGHELGDERLAAHAAIGTGILEAEYGTLAAARLALAEASSGFASLGLESSVRAVEANLASLQGQSGDVAGATAAVDDLLGRLDGSGEAGICWELRLLRAELAVARGDVAAAAALASSWAMATPPPSPRQRLRLRAASVARDALRMRPALDLEALTRDRGLVVAEEHRADHRAVALLLAELRTLRGEATSAPALPALISELEQRGSPRERSRLWDVMAVDAWWRCDFAQAGALAQRARSTWQARGEVLGAAQSMALEARVALVAGGSLDLDRLAPVAAALPDDPALSAVMALDATRCLVVGAAARTRWDAIQAQRLRGDLRLPAWIDAWVWAVAHRDADMAREAMALAPSEVWPVPPWARAMAPAGGPLPAAARKGRQRRGGV